MALIRLIMKTKAICSLFVLFAIASGVATTATDAFADHSEVTIVPAAGSSVSGCETTPEGCNIPDPAIVDVGGTVIMSNTDIVAHTWVSGYASDDVGGLVFNSGLVLPGQTYQWSPDTAGEYPYFCIVHPWMLGTITVQEAMAADDGDKERDGDMMDGKSMMMMEEDASGTGMLEDGTKVLVWAYTPTADEELKIAIQFADAEHVNYDVVVTQNDVEVLNEMGAHEHEGVGKHTTMPLSSSDPVDIKITFQGYGVEEVKTGPIGNEVEFVNVIPEFGTIAMMVLAVAIISIVAVTAKSRVVPRL